MSLVAYGASDDENTDSSDSENEEQFKSTSQTGVSSSEANTTVKLSWENTVENTGISSGHISDDDDYEHVSSTSTSAIFSSDVSSTVFSTTSTLEALPKPQSQRSSEDVIVEDELEEEVKAKESERAAAPKPPKKKQTVKITIPSLNDSQEEEDFSSKKKNAAVSRKKGGLFSLLPAPMHSARKEINRPLIPHSVGKKTTPSKGAPSKPSNISKSAVRDTAASSPQPSTVVGGDSPKRMSQFNALTGYDDSDSDAETEGDAGGTNFFSINSSRGSSLSAASSISNPTKTPSLINPGSERVQSEEISSSDVSSKTGLEKSGVSNVSMESKEVEGEEVNVPEPIPEPGLTNDAPLDFGSRSTLRQWAVGSQSFLSPVGPSGPVMPTQGMSQSHSASASAMYNMVNSHWDAPVEVEAQPVADDDLRQLMSDREFMQFQGKRKRGREEEITFVDANVDDYVDPSEITKHLSEETEYVSHKANKDNLPTSQQKRKKQITYLAHQAKEKEFELKNTWAQNRMTKKQTQSKYGF